MKEKFVIRAFLCLYLKRQDYYIMSILDNEILFVAKTFRTFCIIKLTSCISLDNILNECRIMVDTKRKPYLF